MTSDAHSPDRRQEVAWDRLRRETLPHWFRDAKLGVFIHWGAYSVPAWAEPTGELGAVDEATWFRHNPYAEWYWNTIRFEDSPARRHHQQVYDDGPYDDFLDSWTAEDFDPAEWVQLFARTGAGYVVPTTKHHDGIALWDAPGTATRNTVHRGPRRDLVGELESATRAAGLRFGVYYSGGLDWSVSDLPPLDSHDAVSGRRPNDAAYAAYAYLHVRDLIDRYRPDVLWNDIEWPDFGKHDGPLGLFELFQDYYKAVPEGVVNDRWGDTHWDYRTSEYQHGLDNESAQAWENCRGIGLSFGYNSVEDESHLLDGPGLVRHLADVVSRGGNFLLNVGPTAQGTIPSLQRRSLEQLGDWMAVGGTAIHGSRPLDPSIATPSEDPWVRWTSRDGYAYAIVDGKGETALPVRSELVDAAAATLVDGAALPIRVDNAGTVFADLSEPTVAGPVVVRFPVR